MASQLPQDLRYEDNANVDGNANLGGNADVRGIVDVDGKDIFGPVYFAMLRPITPKPLPRLRHVTRRLQDSSYDVSPEAREIERQKFRSWRERATRPRPDLPSGPELLNEWRSELDRCRKSVNLLAKIDVGEEAQEEARSTQSAEDLDKQEYTMKGQAIKPEVDQSELYLPLRPKRIKARDAGGRAEMSARFGHNIIVPIEDKVDDPFYAPIDFSVIEDPFPEFRLQYDENPFHRSASDAAPVNVSGPAQHASVSTPTVDDQSLSRTTRLRATTSSRDVRSIYNMHSARKSPEKRTLAYRQPREAPVLAPPASQTYSDDGFPADY